MGLPWSRLSPSNCGHSPRQRFLALRATPTPSWHCALPWCSRFTWSLRVWLPHLRRYALRLPLAHYSHHRPHPVQPLGWEVRCGYPYSTRLSVTVMSHWGFPVTCIRYGRIRQDTAGYGRIRQYLADTARYGRIRQDTAGYGRIRQDTAGYGRIRRIRQDTAGYRRIRQIRQDTAGYGRIRGDTTGSKISACLHHENNHFAFIQRSVVFHTVLACLL